MGSRCLGWLSPHITLRAENNRVHLTSHPHEWKELCFSSVAILNKFFQKMQHDIQVPLSSCWLQKKLTCSYVSWGWVKWIFLLFLLKEWIRWDKGKTAQVSMANALQAGVTSSQCPVPQMLMDPSSFNNCKKGRSGMPAHKKGSKQSRLSWLPPCDSRNTIGQVEKDKICWGRNAIFKLYKRNRKH